MTRLLGGDELRRAVTAALDVLRSRRAAIDAANVYPVPDGDTGTNLVLTFEAVAAALAKAGGGDAEAARAVKSGSLMGARGNSGVIMAQFLRGLADAFEEGPADAGAIARAMKRAVEMAYEAVLEPAEGTILTVARAAADAAQGSHSDPVALFDAAAAAAADALAKTPEMMPLLARSGVVDAGGMGLVAVLEAFAATFAGRAIEFAAVEPLRDVPVCDGGSLTYALEVQYMLAAPDDTVPALRQLLGTIGDSVAVIGGDGTYRVHVHTNDRDRAVGFARALGDVSGIEVVEFAAQMAAARAVPEEPPAAESMRAVLEEPRAQGARGVDVARPDVGSALVAVASGDGAQTLFRELGAIVVDGGRTMNPSVGEILAAIESAPAEHVFVLPNNDNVLAAAQTAAGQTTKKVHVMRSSDMAEGLAVAVAFGEARSVEANEADMLRAIEEVRTGQVVLSTMTAETPLGRVEEGQAIGFAEGSPLGIEDDPIRSAVAVARALLTPGTEVLTVLAGDGVDESERARLRERLESIAGSAAVEMHVGGQSVHRYLLAAE